MTKSWGQAQGISPVLYLYPEGSLSSRFSDFVERAKRETDPERKGAWSAIFLDFACFVKPYEGNLWREGGELPNIRFYHEREWRFVPSCPRTLANGCQKLNSSTRRFAARQMSNSGKRQESVLNRMTKILDRS